MDAIYPVRLLFLMKVPLREYEESAWLFLLRLKSYGHIITTSLVVEQ